MFGDIESICDIPLREKLEGVDDYEEAADTKYTEKLWSEMTNVKSAQRKENLGCLPNSTTTKCSRTNRLVLFITDSNNDTKHLSN